MDRMFVDVTTRYDLGGPVHQTYIVEVEDQSNTERVRIGGTWFVPMGVVLVPRNPGELGAAVHPGQSRGVDEGPD